MAKGQKRSNREKKKPKSAPKSKSAGLPSAHADRAALKIGVPSPRQMKKK